MGIARFSLPREAPLPLLVPTTTTPAQESWGQSTLNTTGGDDAGGKEVDTVVGEEDGVEVLGPFLVLLSDALSFDGAEGLFLFLFDGGGADFLFLLSLALALPLPFPFAFGVSGVPPPPPRRGEMRLLVPVLFVAARRSAVGAGV